MANAKISERLQFVDVLPVGTGSARTGTWVSVSGVGRVMARAKFAESTASTASLQLFQATKDDGTGAKPLGDPVTYVTDSTTAEAVSLVVEARASDLDIANDFAYVTAVVGYSDDGGTEATLILGDLAYRPPR